MLAPYDDDFDFLAEETEASVRENAISSYVNLLNPWTLGFPTRELTRKYNSYFFKRTLFSIRLLYSIAVLMIVIIIPIERDLTKMVHRNSALAIALLGGILPILTGLALSFTQHFKNYCQTTTSVCAFLLSVVLLSTNVIQERMNHCFLTTTLMLIFMGVATLARTRAVFVLPVASTVTAVYFVFALQTVDLVEVAYNSILLVAGTVLAVFAAHEVEKNEKSTFLNTWKLLKENKAYEERLEMLQTLDKVNIRSLREIAIGEVKHMMRSPEISDFNRSKLDVVLSALTRDDAGDLNIAQFDKKIDSTTQKWMLNELTDQNSLAQHYTGSTTRTYNAYEIPADALKYDVALGVGSFGMVWKGEWRGSTVAIKRIRSVSDDARKDFLSELAFLCELRHPNVILLMGASSKPPDLCMVLEYMHMGSLFNVLKREDVELTLQLQLKIANDVAQGMLFLHGANPAVLHRDLKSPNILIDENWAVKVADFGLSALKTAGGLPGEKSNNYSAYWAPPEVIEEKPNTMASDCFAYGIVLWEIMTRQIPYNNDPPIAVCLQVLKGRRPDCSLLQTEPMSEVLALITECWEHNQTNRPMFSQIVHTLKRIKVFKLDESESWKMANLRTSLTQGTLLRHKTRIGLDIMDEDEVARVMANFSDWDFNVFAIEERNWSPIYTVGLHVFKSTRLMEHFAIPEAIVRSFLTEVDAMYNNQPYHNSLHAADVLHAMIFFLRCPPVNHKVTPLDLLGSVVAAIVHDLGHEGRNNNFQIATLSPHALMYNDQSPLENYHCATAFTILSNPMYDVLGTLNTQERVYVRKLIINCLLATDNTHHFKYVSRFNSRLEATLDLTDLNTRLFVIAMMLKCADISNPAKPYHLYIKWVDRVMEEFFQQGDDEKRLSLSVSPFMDRQTTDISRCQVGFMDYICYPLYEKVVGEFLKRKDIVEICARNREEMQTKVGMEESTPTATKKF